MNPAVFECDKDFLTWRKKIASWVDLISTAAKKGDDKLCKTILHTLGRQLYYKQDDQVKAVQEIIDLMAQAPPISVVTLLIDSFNKVTSCRRDQKEDMKRFVAK